MFSIQSIIGRIGSVLLVSSLTSCGFIDTIDGMLPDNRENYKASEESQPLELPPGFESTRIRDEMVINRRSSSGTATLSEYTGQAPVAQPTARPQASAVVLPSSTKVQLKRAGDQQWLVIGDSPDKVWAVLRQFWREQGIALVHTSAPTGLMETEWLPHPDHASRDKYRIRLEHGETEQQTRVFLTHRRVVPQPATALTPTVAPTDRAAELSGGAISHEAVVPRISWQAASSDAELEAEMLQRLLVFAGIAQPRTEALLMAEAESDTPPAGVPIARLERQGQQTHLLVAKELAETWQRAGIVLDRIGFTVTERDQATRTYVVRYEDPDAATEEEDKGFFSSFFGSDDDNFVQTYQIALSPVRRDLTRIQVLDDDGKAVKTQAASRILSLLQEQI